MKKLLLLGCSYAYGTEQFIDYAHSQGIYVIVTDDVPVERAIGKQLADEYWMIPVDNYDELYNKCVYDKIDGIFAAITAKDIDAMIEMCGRLNLPCYTDYYAWHFTNQKRDFKKICAEVGAPIADDYILTEDMIASEKYDIKFPVIVKPVDLCGNKGVAYCYNKDDVKHAYDVIRDISDNKDIIVEKMLSTPEISPCYAIADGVARLIQVSELCSQPGELKNLYSVSTSVSKYTKKYIEEAEEHAQNILRKIGCKDGCAWFELLIDPSDGHLKFIEMGYRLAGDMNATALKYSIDFDIVAWMIDYAMGIKHEEEDLPIAIKEMPSRISSDYMFWIKNGGKIASIEGIDEINKIPNIDLVFRGNIGDTYETHRHMGQVIFAAESVEEMVDMIKYINDTLVVLNEDGQDMLIKYNNFDYLRENYRVGLNGE